MEIEEYVMSAESYYLDAIEAEENGELEDALEHARKAVKATLSILTLGG